MTKNTFKTPFDDIIFNPFKDFDMSLFKKNMPDMGDQWQLMQDMNKLSVDTFQKIMKLQQDYLRDIAQEWTHLAQFNMTNASLADKSSKQVHTMQHTGEKAKANLQEISAVVEKSQKEAMDIFNKAKK